MEGHLLMSAKERRRKSVFDRVKMSQLTLVEAAEELAEEGYGLDHETLRRWLLAEGLWRKRKKGRKHRSRPPPKAHFGELVQMDGSHHRWFGPERPEACLMDIVDDATGHTMALMAPAETTEAAMELLWRWIEEHGIPKALYTDRKNVFVTSREPTLEEQLAGEEPMTAFGKACAKLGIEIICAHSPQAKGRVERKHKLYQDRLVKKLALRGITTIKTTNKLLNNGFTNKLNAKLAKPALSNVDFHRPVPKELELADVFCSEELRTVQNDWTIRYQNRHYQILKDNTPLPKPRQKVLVRVRLDKTMDLIYCGKPLAFRAIAPAELRRRLANKAHTPEAQAQVPGPRVIHKPAPDHPWRKAAIPRAADKQRF